MTETAPSGTWSVTSRQVTRHRIEAEVDGLPLWVACDDAPLIDRPEAWGSAFALPAARAGAGLSFAAPLDRTWTANAQRVVEQAATWWGGAAHPTWIAPEPRLPDGIRRRLRRPAAGRALCFTGGVDSFFSLRCGDHQPTHLLFVVGFDVPVDDADRAAAVTALVREVADATGLVPIIVRTDLRTHPRFASISWEHTHGAALAAVGHLLAATIGTLVIPPSYAHDRLVPWGSRPDLDPLWSVPRRLEVQHGDASDPRLRRVLAIVDDPLVQRHLRVCWQNLGTDPNCGRCEKCVRTMAMLAGAGVLDRCATFPDRRGLAERIDDLDAVPAGLWPLWTDLTTIGLHPDEEAAIDALLARSSA